MSRWWSWIAAAWSCTVAEPSGISGDRATEGSITSVCRLALPRILDLKHRDVEVVSSNARAYRVAYGLLEMSRRLAATALRVADDGGLAECQPLARQSLEFAVRGHWVSCRGDTGVDVLLTDYRGTVNKIAKDARIAGLGSLTDPVPVHPAYKGPLLGQWQRFEQVCLSLGHDVGRQIYVMYRLLSQHVHPSLPVASAFLPETVEPFAVLADPRVEHLRDVPQALAFSALWATRSLDDMLKRPVFETELDQISEEIGALPRLPQVG